MNRPILELVLFYFTRFGFTEDGSMLRYSLIVIERDGESEAATSKTEKGEIENGIHWTGSPCWCSKDVVNRVVFVLSKDEILSGAAESKGEWEPR
jgi:hypothetical protein